MRISDWSSDVCSSDLPKKFKKYEIGYFHVDIAELRYEGGRGFLYVEVDRTSKLVFARIYRRATKLAAAAFLRVLIKPVPYRIRGLQIGRASCRERGCQYV